MSTVSDDDIKREEIELFHKASENVYQKVVKNFQKEDLVEFSADLSEIHCQLLDTGIKEVYAKYYICECDPERSNPICEKCFKTCHCNGAKFPHKEIKSESKVSVCICGYKSHKPLYASEQSDKHYKQLCTFGESDYEQNQAEGFINLYGLPIKVTALLDLKNK